MSQPLKCLCQNNLAKVSGRETVDADCTGSFVSTGPDGSVIHNDFVIDDNEKEIRLIATESGYVAVCIFRKQ